MMWLTIQHKLQSKHMFSFPANPAPRERERHQRSTRTEASASSVRQSGHRVSKRWVSGGHCRHAGARWGARALRGDLLTNKEELGSDSPAVQDAELQNDSRLVVPVLDARGSHAYSPSCQTALRVTRLSEQASDGF